MTHWTVDRSLSRSRSMAGSATLSAVKSLAMMTTASAMATSARTVERSRRAGAAAAAAVGVWRAYPARPVKQEGRSATLEVLDVDLGEALPLVGQLVLGEARVDRARLDAGVAVDALLWVNVELLYLVVVRLLGCRMDAVDRAHLDARVVLRADARLGDDVGHCLLGSSLWGGGGRAGQPPKCAAVRPPSDAPADRCYRRRRPGPPRAARGGGHAGPLPR